MRAWAGIHRVMIELTPDEARALLPVDGGFDLDEIRRLDYLADLADLADGNEVEAAEPVGVTVRDNTGQVVHQALCLCAACEDEHREQQAQRLADAMPPLDHRPELACCACDDCGPRT